MGLLDGKLAFEDGRLFAYERTRVIAIRAWPDPGMWTGGDDRSCRLPLHLRLGLAEIDLKAKSCDPVASVMCGALLETLPRELGEDALRFPEHSWHLLALIWSAREAIELVHSNPALAFAVACRTELKTRVEDGRWPDAKELVKKRREELAGWLEFPATGSAVSILSRATHEIIHLRGLRTLRTLLNSEDEHLQKLLRHVRHINADVLEVLSAPELASRVTPSLLEEVSFIRSAEGHVADRLRRAIRDWNTAAPGGEFPIARTLSELDRVILRIEGMENYRRLKREHTRERMFPPPPIPGNDDIRPITSLEGLIDEGIQQKNCAGDYGTRVCHGAVYVYQVLKPERCTLSILRGATGLWHLDQLRSKCNRPPQNASTLRVVNRWIADYLAMAN